MRDLLSFTDVEAKRNILVNPRLYPYSVLRTDIIFHPRTLDLVSLAPWSSLMPAVIENVSYLNY